MKLRKRERGSYAFAGRNIKNSIVMSAGILFYGIVLLMRIPLTRVIGDAGVGLFAPAFEIFVLSTFFTSYSMSRAMTGLIRYRVKREQYRNARKVFRAAFWLNLIIGLVLAGVIVLAAYGIANVVVLEPLGKMAVMMAAPSVFFAAMSGVFRGYFNGHSLSMVAAHSQYIEGISMAVCAPLCGRMSYSHGEKITALLQLEAYTYEYGAFGASFGVMLSQVITLLYLLLMYGVYSGTVKRKEAQDNSRRMEMQHSLQRMLAVNCIPAAAAAVFTNLFMLIDQRMFNYCMNKQELGGTRTALWGCYYGKVMVLIGLGAAIVCLSIQMSVGKVSSSYEREEYRVMRERLGRAVKRLCIVAFPMAIYIAVLAQALTGVLFKGDTEPVAGLVRKGAVIIAFYGFCYLFAQLMLKIRAYRELLVVTAVSLLIHIASAYFLVQRALLGVEGIIYSVILFFAVYAALSFTLVVRNLKYRQDWIGTVAFTALAAGVSGVLVFLMNKLLLDAAGEIATILVSILVGIFLYIMLLMVLRVIGEAELTRMPLGFLFIMLGRNIGVLR